MANRWWKPEDDWPAPEDLGQVRAVRRLLLQRIDPSTGRPYARSKVACFLDWWLNLDEPSTAANPESKATYRKMLVALSEVPSGNPGPASQARDAGSGSIAAVVGTATVLLTVLATRRPELSGLVPPIIHDPVNFEEGDCETWGLAA